MKTFTNVISAHSHVSKSDIFKDLEGEIRGSWAVGCLCNLSPAYNPINQWQHGFAVVDIDTDGDFEINNRIIDGRKTFNS
jgi:poly(A) polymerase Pap1